MICVQFSPPLTSACNSEGAASSRYSFAQAVPIVVPAWLELFSAAPSRLQRLRVGILKKMNFSRDVSSRYLQKGNELDARKFLLDIINILPALKIAKVNHPAIIAFREELN